MAMDLARRMGRDATIWRPAGVGDDRRDVGRSPDRGLMGLVTRTPFKGNVSMEDWVQQFLTTIVAILFVAALLGFVGLLLLHRRLRRIRIPPNADLAKTLRAVPLSLVIVPRSEE